ncbi:hypothetical protein F53441_7023 [Fusarium austroafricanum]|uniref:Uncharacterized protein n=1 Tax=Fusarium austroafricanum TaxID=2364996 RepID=A0A8H4KHK5_9HYPO|nr:hypothetical protein F53441_7023 [Fusarium austroafricanum]
MSDSRPLPQIQDEPTELSFVGSDNSFTFSTDFRALSSVIYSQDVDQSLQLDSWPQAAVSLGHFMEQEDILGLAVGSVPSVMGDFSDVDFAEPIIGLDSHLNDSEQILFDTSSSPLSFLDRSPASFEMHPGHVLLSGSPDAAAIL